MKRSSKLLLSATAATVGIALISLTAVASPNHGPNSVLPNQGAGPRVEQGNGQGMMGKMMQRMHGGQNGQMGEGQMGQHMGKGQMGKYMGDQQAGVKHQGGRFGGQMGGQMGGQQGRGNMQAFDTDKDGTLTAEELRTGLTAELKKYDADKDGALSSDEFEALHAARISNKADDRFQKLDTNGDGKVSEEEFAARADNMQNRPFGKQTKRMGQMNGSGPKYN